MLVASISTLGLLVAFTGLLVAMVFFYSMMYSTLVIVVMLFFRETREKRWDVWSWWVTEMSTQGMDMRRKDVRSQLGSD